MAMAQHPEEKPERWTIHVCPGCGSYATPYDLEPRFGNIVAHDDMLEGCLGAARMVEVVPAVVAERLAEAAEQYLNAWNEEGKAAARLELSRALDPFRSALRSFSGEERP